MATQRQKQLVRAEARRWRRWRRRRRQEAVDILQLLDLGRQVGASGAVVTKPPEPLEAL